MEGQKFYSVTENDQELEVLRSLTDAAALWEVSTTRRAVYEVTPKHDSNGRNEGFTRRAQISDHDLAEVMRKPRE